MKKTIVLAGPTGSGKTAIALAFAKKHPEIEIVSADSIQVFRFLNIGSAKPTVDELSLVRHHLIDIRDPDQDFNLGDFYRLATAAISDIHARGKRALVVGGTGFYLQSLLYGLWENAKGDPEIRKNLERLSSEELFQKLKALDPKSLEKISRNDRYRLLRALEAYAVSGKTPSELEEETSCEPNPFLQLFYIDRDSNELQLKIQARVQAMLASGFVEEVKELLSRYPNAKVLKSVGYLQTKNFLEGIAPSGRKMRPGLSGLEDEIVLATRQLVKSQRTWFKSEPHCQRFLLDRQLGALEEEMEKIYS